MSVVFNLLNCRLFTEPAVLSSETRCEIHIVATPHESCAVARGADGARKPGRRPPRHSSEENLYTISNHPQWPVGGKSAFPQVISRSQHKFRNLRLRHGHGDCFGAGGAHELRNDFVNTQERDTQ
ncbi:hypothetical protein [Aureimonas sp. SA4125]|uniref:hypothetical protein n=1 Tax=Aureimonas sp. SA4125 TaxID=2826993 RepID=UPI001CC3510C|nr:hypothetical protein [Aureimonas sp. SA4125]